MTPDELKFCHKQMRELIPTLPPTVVGWSLPDPFREAAGEWRRDVGTEMTRERFAECSIIYKTHRLATPAEVEQMLAERRRSEEQCAALEAQAKRASSLTVSMAVAEAVRSLGIK
jgi:hypothetical protein